MFMYLPIHLLMYLLFTVYSTIYLFTNLNICCIVYFSLFIYLSKFSSFIHLLKHSLVYLLIHLLYVSFLFIGVFMYLVFIYLYTYLCINLLCILSQVCGTLSIINDQLVLYYVI